MKTVYDIMAEKHADLNRREFAMRQTWPYEAKVRHARRMVDNFYGEICNVQERNVHVSVGGLDSITLLIFIRDVCHLDVPGISVSCLEDKSVQKIHKELGIECLKPLKSKVEVLQEFGWPVLSKEIAGKISLLQRATEKNATVRHAILTGETGEYGGNKTGSRMKMSQKWLEKFGGADPEGAALGYAAAPFKVSDRCCYYLKERPCDIWAKEHNSVPYLGLMASEGGRRAKSLAMNGCNYYSKSATRSAPFAIFSRQDLLQLALDLNVPVPEIYGTIERDESGRLYTTGAQRTGCSMCGFGVHLEKRPHRFDRLYERNPKEWEFWMKNAVVDPETGERYGWGRILDYIGVPWTPESLQGEPEGQLNIEEVMNHETVRD